MKKTSPQETAGHNSVPPNKPHYCGSGLLLDYPLEKLFEWCFLNWVLIRHHKFWEIGHFWEFQMKETNSENLGSKRETLAKEKGKGMFEKKTSPQEASGHYSVPPNKLH